MKLIGELKFKGHFIKSPNPEKIESVNGLTQGALRYLMGLEIRSEENRGDTKWHDAEAARMIGYSERSVRNYKNQLIKKGLIGTCSQTVINSQGGLREIQVIRCWRVVIKHRFNIRKKVAWKHDIRPEKTSEMTIDIDPSWLLSSPAMMSSRYSTQLVEPAFNDLFDLVEKGLWNHQNCKAYQEFLAAQIAWQSSAMKVMGYPITTKLKYLNWSEEEIEEYKNN